MMGERSEWALREGVSQNTFVLMQKSGRYWVDFVEIVGHGKAVFLMTAMEEYEEARRGR
ncbi:MAG: hypothetical protein GY795_24640 [Desulfobacterales bacterium]|nr:hypothetical protein [Desulfobacterales bacterium]